MEISKTKMLVANKNERVALPKFSSWFNINCHVSALLNRGELKKRGKEGKLLHVYVDYNRTHLTCSGT